MSKKAAIKSEGTWEDEDFEKLYNYSTDKTEKKKRPSVFEMVKKPSWMKQNEEEEEEPEDANYYCSNIDVTE